MILLAAPGARSRAYVQALVAAGLAPERVVLMGDEVETTIGRGPEGCAAVRLPDPDEPVPVTCARAGIPLGLCEVSNVNDPAVVELLKAAAPRVVIYSGWGGQIVSAGLLGLGFPFLHLHSGDLPDYRGSTTIYYTLLHRTQPGVTAILLDPTIDTGPIIARRQYPPPPSGLDIDRIYDPAIRADLLVRVMAEYARTGALPVASPQQTGEGMTYYVIHPVLKHLAILSLSRKEE